MKARIQDNIIYSPYPSIEIPVCSFYTLARQSLLANPNNLALVNDVVSVTRAEMLAGMERYAVGFRQYGVLPGDRICVHLDHGVENLLAMYGCVLAGAAIVLAKTSLTESDAGYYDESGRLYIVERLKQMIKCMDCQVVPAELEELILCHYADEIAEVSVVGLPHSDYGEAPAAAIVLSEVGGRHDLLTLAERIKATVASNLAEHKHLYGGVYFMDSFPKTETAKVNRPALARSLLRV